MAAGAGDGLHRARAVPVAAGRWRRACTFARCWSRRCRWRPVRRLALLGLPAPELLPALSLEPAAVRAGRAGITGPRHTPTLRWSR
ncbi:MAG: hypothetical protein MZU84_05370 [Sphingobacterium sp.]|nr:hypothetical protein [Sphingobacterium sp.]